MNEYETLTTEFDRGWLTIRLNAPDTRNALSAKMLDELLAVLGDAAGNPRVRGVALRGNGGVFCAGGDLKGFRALFQDGSATHSEVAAYNKLGGRLFQRLASMPQLTLALVEGVAMAGGVGLTCASDIAIATADARFAFTETQIGIPPAQIAPLVAARLGLSQARQLLLLGRRLSAEEALQAGIVDRVVADAGALDLAAMDVRDQLEKCSSSAIAATKSILSRYSSASSESLMSFAGDEFASCLLSAGGREGIAAFLEKRRPVWDRS